MRFVIAKNIAGKVEDAFADCGHNVFKILLFLWLFNPRIAFLIKICCNIVSFNIDKLHKRHI